MSTLEEEQIINRLYALNCCKQCIIRLLGKTQLEECSEYEITLQYITSKYNGRIKIARPSPCRACLNLLSFVEDLSTKILDTLKKLRAIEYCLNFHCPKALDVRQKSFEILLIDEYSDYFHGFSYLSPAKCLKFLINQELLKHHFEHNNQSRLNFMVYFQYTSDVDEIKELTPIDQQVMKYNKQKLTELIDKLSVKDFELYIGVPCKTPIYPVDMVKFQFEMVPVAVGGRYIKMDSELKQYNPRDAQESVQSIISDGFKKHLRLVDGNLKIYICGRDVKDLRVVGTGRPFAVQVKGLLKLTEGLLRLIEESINKSTVKMKVLSLKVIHNNQVKILKQYENKAERVYNTICITEAPCVKSVVKKINYLNETMDLMIVQKNPISSLHKRLLCSRRKRIVNMEAAVVPQYPKVFQLKLVVAPGTYIDDFVHGDFGRTKPCLSDLIGYSTYIVAKDLVDFKMVFPIADVVQESEEEDGDFDG